MEGRNIDWHCAMRTTNLLLLHIRSHCLNAIAALDDVCLQRYRSRAAMQLEKQTAGVAEDGAHLVATP